MTTGQSTRHLARPAQGQVAYDLQGSGPLILLVPGMGDLRSTYRFLTPALVAAGYTVATTDLRGHGGSTTSFSGYGDEETARDLAALLQELGEPAVIVGNSMAAGAAVIVAADHPGLVSGLVLIGPFVREPAASAAARLFFRILMAPQWAAASWKACLPKLYAGRKPEDFAAYRNELIASMKRPGYARAFSLTTRTDHVQAGNSLAAASTPTLVIMGEQDPDFGDPRAEAEWVSAALCGSVTMVPDAGHYPHSQHPELTSSAILTFLATKIHHA
ncbi:alpha/beta hydrolase [Arthrobacter sp. H20]|uniref:alpha/beta fold hydrolase n=1 Tax=Arthrobacter sp. H20 TaxID=1267981 RepID=UPI00047ACDC3|nr:alpha/beta hydrolase [Arthrobacter sp. H20]